MSKYTPEHVASMHDVHLSNAIAKLAKSGSDIPGLTRLQAEQAKRGVSAPSAPAAKLYI